MTERGPMVWLAWQLGRIATLDVTVVHTLAAAYVAQRAVDAGRKRCGDCYNEEVCQVQRFAGLSSSHIFIPSSAVESLGPFVDDARRFVKEMGRRVTFITADPRETASCTSTSQRRFSVTTCAVCLADTFIPVKDDIVAENWAKN